MLFRSRELIGYCWTQEQLDEQETYWIRHFRSNDPNIGFNLDGGGTGCDKHNCNKAKFTVEDENMICASYLNGDSSYAISKVFGTSKVPIIRVLKESNIKIRGNIISFSTEIESKIIEEYYAGGEMRRIAKRYDTCREVIVKILKKHSVEIRPTTWARTIESRIKQSQTKKTKLTESQLLQMKELYKNGASYSAVGRTVGVSGDTAKRILAEDAGAVLRPTPTKPTEEQIGEMKKMYLGGLSFEKIAEKIGDWSWNSIRTYLISAGVKIRDGRFNSSTVRYHKIEFSSDQVNEIARLYTSGTSTRTLAKMYNLKSRHTISRILSGQNIHIHYKNSCRCLQPDSGSLASPVGV